MLCPDPLLFYHFDVRQLPRLFKERLFRAIEAEPREVASAGDGWNPVVHQYGESDHQVDVVGDTANSSFTYEMVYDSSGKRTRTTGRDLWIFSRQVDEWIAVWLTMLDLAEQPA